MRSRRCSRLAVAASLPVLLAYTAASADPLAVVNSLRTDGCGPVAGDRSVIHAEPTLHLVAKRLADERGLEPALDELGYPAISATSFHVRGSGRDEDIGRILAARFCDSLLDERYTEGGYFRDDAETWIVLATPGPAEIRLDPELTAGLVLGLVNAARAEARTCGDQTLPPAGPLVLSSRLSSAALAHAEDMAARGRVSHAGSDGSGPAERVTRSGYTWQAVGENVAGGQRSADAVVAAWLESPGHCATLMGGRFTETGVAFVLAPDRNPVIYWAQVFAAP